MILTPEKFKEMFPLNGNTAIIFAVFEKYFAKYEINTTNRIAGFLAQCGHESNGFTVFKENLNYSAEGLVKTFPKYFPNIASTAGFAKNPQKIANKVYANRMGNGSEESGDGYLYRGRGVIQLTGKDNYKAFANFKVKTLTDVITYLETTEGAIESGLWFWKTRGLNAVCDTDDIIKMTKIINGGTNGLDDRKLKYNNFKVILGA
jgi:putative chitinase